MSTGRKLWAVLLIVGFTVANLLILTALWGVMANFIGVANADPVLSGNHASDFSLYKSVVGAAPFWLYLIAPVVGVIECVIVLKSKEIVQGVRDAVSEFRGG